jgi:hypothetical protein
MDKSFAAQNYKFAANQGHEDAWIQYETLTEDDLL